MDKTILCSQEGKPIANIKLFVSCHQLVVVPDLDFLYPIQVGAALAEKRFSGFLQDDEGDNISAKNPSYCELTAQYWAWKNVQADYYGFFHYRRYLYPNTKTKHPYCVEKCATADVMKRLKLEELLWKIPQYDLIFPIGEDMHIPVWEQYAKSLYHHEKDLRLMTQILLELHPEYQAAAEQYLSGTICQFGNIFIAKKEMFRAYCDWLFPMLQEFDRRADLTGYNRQELRVDGYLAERLFGIWETYHQELRSLELPRVLFIEDGIERWKMKLTNYFLPPGSVRRSKVKKVAETWKRTQSCGSFK